MLQNNLLNKIFRIVILLLVCLASVLFIQITDEAVGSLEATTASTLMPTISVNTPQATINATSIQESNYTILCTATPYVSPNANYEHTESTTTLCTEFTTPTIEPTPTAEPYPHSNGEWFIAYATSYIDSGTIAMGLKPRGCIDNIPLVAGWSCASFLDEYLPYGTIIEIEGIGIRIICDTCKKDGEVWNQRVYDITKGKFQRAETWLDIYFDNKEDADEFGRKLVRVRILKYGDGKTYISEY